MANKKLELSETEISLMSHYKFKKIIRNKIEDLVELFFKSQKEKLDIKTFKPQEYLLAKDLSTEKVKNLFKMRKYGVYVKENFQLSHENMY